MATFKIHEDKNKEIKSFIRNNNDKDGKISRKRFALQSLKKNETGCFEKRVKLTDTDITDELTDTVICVIQTWRKKNKVH